MSTIDVKTSVPIRKGLVVKSCITGIIMVSLLSRLVRNVIVFCLLISILKGFTSNAIIAMNFLVRKTVRRYPEIIHPAAPVIRKAGKHGL